VGYAVVCLQFIQSLACLKLIAEPAALYFLFLAALSYLAERVASSFSAAFIAAEFHHAPKNFVALPVVLELFEEGKFRENFRRFIEPDTSEFLPQIPGQISDYSFECLILEERFPIY
jgi:hypothetical protein